MKRNMKKTTLVLALAALLGLGACSTTKKLEGNIAIDGSSTVYPVTEAVAEEFNAVYPDVKVSVGFSGTGGGMSKFIAKEIDIADASRKIKSSEAEAATAAGIEYLEIKVGFDGLSILVNPENTWVTSLTVEQLKEMWKPGSTIMNWSDIDPTWPNEKIVFYAPGVDSGTFDYFTEAIVGELDAMRSDYTGSEDDNVLVQGIAGDKYAIGFFGFAYYEENADKLKLVGVDKGAGAIVPSFETIADGSYAPLSRPLYIYVNKASLEREEVLEFVTFYLENAKELVADVGYVPLPDADYEASLELLK
ncbi:MAG: PstS family phosphate ABC transporter substrate-binding protein [Erysipelotrichaceae bacterium]